MSVNQTKTDLQKIEKKLVKLRNKMGRKDLEYLVQVSINSTDPTVVRYAVQMTPPAEGLAPITFIGNTVAELVERIEAATKGIDLTEVEKAYHEAQVVACERTIAHHKERLEKLNNPEPETPTEAAVTEE